MQGAGEAEQQSARSTAAQIFFWQKPFAASQPLPRAQSFPTTPGTRYNI